jgi:uncharacterized protein (UPF0332 family)
MSFDWLDYLDLALELSSQAASSRHHDANLRSSISRAYYATYHKSRQFLKQKWGISVPKNSGAHKRVRHEFKRREQYRIEENLYRMRDYRNNADYEDTFAKLEEIAEENIILANEIISDLSLLNQPTHETSSQAIPSASSDVSDPNIDKLYIFRDTNNVTSFLEENQFLVPLLQEAYIQLKEYFPSSDFVLEVVNTSEVVGEEQLVASIVVKQDPEKASLDLDRFDEHWWLDNMDRAKDKLCIALEFV